MNRYDYEGVMREDILAAVKEMHQEGILPECENASELALELVDEMWGLDSVTGNGSGSYFCNTWEAEEAICHNIHLYEESLAEFGCEPVFCAEAIDVSIRCYLLPQVLQQLADDGELEEFVVSAGK